MTKIKLCGLSKEEDIFTANTLPIDYIGFVFAKNSRRYVSHNRAKQLKELLNPNIQAVGVFVDADLEEIIYLARYKIIDLIQLHGAEDEEYIYRLQKAMRLFDPDNKVLKIIKAFRLDFDKKIDNAEEVSQGANHTQDTDEIFNRIHHTLADYILLDSKTPGGGEVFDWSILKKVQREFFLAGGLNTENIETALRTIRPFGVDTSSGIEQNGTKCVKKMKQFVDSVRSIRD